MNSTNLIILVFGIILLAWIINQKKEGFSFFDKIEQMIDILDDEQPKLQKDWDLAQEMKKVMEIKQKEIDLAPTHFKHQTQTGIEPTNMYYPMVNNKGEQEFLPVNTARFSEDITKLDWKLEKDPKQVINEMKSCGRPLPIKDAFDQSIKNYKKLNPEINDDPDFKKNSDNTKALDQDGFSYLEGKQPTMPKQDDIFAFDPINSSFSHF